MKKNFRKYFRECKVYFVRNYEGNYLHSQSSLEENNPYYFGWGDLGSAKVFVSDISAKMAITNWGTQFPQFGIPELVPAIIKKVENGIDQTERVVKTFNKKDYFNDNEKKIFNLIVISSIIELNGKVVKDITNDIKYWNFDINDLCNMTLISWNEENKCLKLKISNERNFLTSRIPLDL